jgi:hypothetical protein
LINLTLPHPLPLLKGEEILCHQIMRGQAKLRAQDEGEEKLRSFDPSALRPFGKLRTQGSGRGPQLAATWVGGYMNN